MGKFGIGKEAVGNKAAARRAVTARKVVENDATIIFADVRELRAAGAFTRRPNAGRARFEPFVDTNVAARFYIDVRSNKV